MSGVPARRDQTNRPAQRPAANVAVGDRIGLGAALLIALLLYVTATSAAEIGDFGRVVVDDRGLVPPFSRDWRAPNGRTIKGFNITDEEREMHDRVWRFLRAPHARDWGWERDGELKLLPANARAPGYDRYYRWLTGVPFQSSHVRYNTIADAVGADLLTLPTTFRAICVVLEIDRQRAVAVTEIAGIEPQMRHQREQREAENRAFIGRFVGALGYRYASYGYALDHFLVETPHGEAIEVDARLSDLAIWVDLAERQDFCGGRDDWTDGNGAIPGRVLLDAPSEGEYRK